MRNGELAHQVLYAVGFGSVLFEEFQPRGNVVEKVAHDNASAVGAACGFILPLLAAAYDVASAKLRIVRFGEHLGL